MRKEQRRLDIIDSLTIEFNLIAVGGRSDTEQIADEDSLCLLLAGIFPPYILREMQVVTNLFEFLDRLPNS